MKVTETELPGVLLIEPDIHEDHRGRFLETWNEDRYPALPTFVQDNVSRSRKGVLRGLHYQHPHPQGKLITVLHGEVFDVAVDLRRGAPTFGRWWGTRLAAADHRQLWIPEGFAHGFVALADDSIVSYKCSALYSPAGDRSVLWSDPEIGIDWPISDPSLSEKDRSAPRLKELGEEDLPAYG